MKMKIKGFPSLVEKHLGAFQLENTEVVVDGESVYNQICDMVNVPYIFGSECDQFTKFIKTHLDQFKRANLKCHFLMKGGHENELPLHINFMIGTKNEDQFIFGKSKGGKNIQPCLCKDVYLQALEEMGFDYAICNENDAIKECFDLAERLSCPVLSFNIQYCFSAAPYIPLTLRVLNCDQQKYIKSGIFKRDNFLQHYKISKEKMIIFILLTDTNIFEENVFLEFFKAFNIPCAYLKRYECLLKWLSRKDESMILETVFKYIPSSSKQKFLETKSELEIKFLSCKDEESTASLYFTNRESLEFSTQDPLWFEKGITLKYIAVPYINLYFSERVSVPVLGTSNHPDGSFIISILEIIKYAFDLLHNFNNRKFSIKNRDGELNEIGYQFINKPDYDALNCVFENGWKDIDTKRLFEHFFTEKFGSFNFAALEATPVDARLLLITMVYFSRVKERDVTCEIYSIIVSYVLLGIVADKVTPDLGKSKSHIDLKNKPIIDTITDKDLVTTQDCNSASARLERYCNVHESELHKNKFQRGKIYDLTQFERCLLEINYLNQLCGSPYAPTVYSKTYNAKFAYKFLQKLTKQSKETPKNKKSTITSSQAFETLNVALGPAPTVLAFVSGMIKVYEKILYDY